LLPSTFRLARSAGVFVPGNFGRAQSRSFGQAFSLGAVRVSFGFTFVKFHAACILLFGANVSTWFSRYKVFGNLLVWWVVLLAFPSFFQATLWFGWSQQSVKPN
jgi:hypothetical protein